ncbi:hypothetical protein DSO57_1027993 [Entomophthora muscae]|uniref:Uncharacterized protein n=1 Tax=Entomophthora muscae TaxID=34485 RepID=A0ACC2RSH0_9FUNG|nr:hypothetical protein DSO57_1027993 [Entomophthora muscae]
MINKMVFKGKDELLLPYEEMEPSRRRVFRRFWIALDISLAAMHYVPFVLLLVATRGSIFYCTLVSWCLSEILFYFCWQGKLHYRKSVFIKMDAEARLQQALQVCDHMQDVSSDISGWIVPQPEGISFNNLVDWINYAFFNKKTGQLTLAEWKRSDDILDVFKNRVKLKKTIDRSFCLTPSLDKPTGTFRPLFFHLFLSLPKLAINAALSLYGFTWHPASKGISYWMYEPAEEEGTPILFLHGLVFGVYMYTNQLAHLVSKYPKRRIIATCIPCSSLDLAAPILSLPEIAKGISKILDENSVLHVSAFGHSYGSVVAAWLIKLYPTYVTKLTLANPICFETWNSQLIFRALYSQPTSFMHDFFLFWVNDAGMDLYMHTYSPFQWFIFPESIPIPTQIFLATQDLLIDGPKCYNYLNARKQESKLENMHLQLINTTHTGFVIDSSLTKQFLASV